MRCLSIHSVCLLLLIFNLIKAAVGFEQIPREIKQTLSTPAEVSGELLSSFRPLY